MVRHSVSLVKEPRRDNEEDFRTGPLRRALALLAIPMMLEMAVASIFEVLVSESLLTVLSVLVFMRGNWRHHGA